MPVCRKPIVGSADDDVLAVELEHETQHAVRAGVLRPHVHGHRFGANVGISPRFSLPRSARASRASRAARDVRRRTPRPSAESAPTTPCPCESAPGSPCAADGPSQSSAIRMRRRSGWPSNASPNRSKTSRSGQFGGRIDRRSRSARARPSPATRTLRRSRRARRRRRARHRHVRARPGTRGGRRPRSAARPAGSRRPSRRREARTGAPDRRAARRQTSSRCSRSTYDRRHVDRAERLDRGVRARPRAATSTTGDASMESGIAALTRSSASGRSYAAAARCRR